MGLGEIVVSREELEAGITRLAGEINRDYAGRDPLFIGILKGSIYFLADLTRQIDGPIEIELIRASSYGKATVSSGEVKIVAYVGCDVKGRDVILVEDIIDTGLTIRKIIAELLELGAKSVRVCALLRKRTGKNDDVSAYVGFEIDDVYVVGYGLDAAERYRNVPEIRSFIP
jgi:hypoxanthine phosphoribosyltransferase